MPKSTFNNLNENKKQKIFNAAVREFSLVRFSEASINQILRNAGIPKGSFYQYFESKEDLYLYMYRRIEAEKHKIAALSGLDARELDVFEASIQATKATLEWAQQNPALMKIAMLMEVEDCEFISALRSEIRHIFEKKIEIDKEHGIIKPDADAELVADMIYTLIWKLGSIYLMDAEMFFKKLSEGIKIIKEGIGQ